MTMPMILLQVFIVFFAFGIILCMNVKQLTDIFNKLYRGLWLVCVKYVYACLYACVYCMPACSTFKNNLDMLFVSRCSTLISVSKILNNYDVRLFDSHYMTTAKVLVSMVTNERKKLAV